MVRQWALNKRILLSLPKFVTSPLEVRAETWRLINRILPMWLQGKSEPKEERVLSIKREKERKKERDPIGIEDEERCSKAATESTIIN